MQFDDKHIFEYDVQPWITFKYVKKDIADEMLDALISIVKLHTLPDKTKEIDIAIEAIEKATGKPIDQILKESQNG